MPIINAADLKPLKNNRTRLLGVDLGDKTIGLSVSDTTWFIASPLETIRRKHLSADLAAFHKAIKDYDVVAIVIGLPINMNGTEGPQAGKVRSFVNTVLEQNDLPVVLWDERLSTTAVTRTMLTADMSRSKRAAVVDKLAASYILQGVLDLINRS